MDANKLYWWGYLHENGSVQVKRWFGDHADYTSDCQGNPFVIRVVRPFVADSRDEATAHICKALGVQSGFIEIEWAIVLAVVAIIVALLIGLFKHEFAEEQRFDRLMAECLQDHKEYECEAILRTGNTSTLVPMPIIIPSR